MAIKVGDIMPHFVSYDSHGNKVDSNEFLGKPLVIYFYPKDETRVCTEQACAFRDYYEDFKSYGAEVIGISSDSEKSHQRFVEKYKLPFILLTDQSRKLRKLFGVPNDLLGLIPGRVTYVIDKEGIVRMVFNSMLGKIHIEKALNEVQNLAKK